MPGLDSDGDISLDAHRPIESLSDTASEDEDAGSPAVEMSGYDMQPMSDVDWMDVLYPNVSSRNFTETFHWWAFFREFTLHFFHPVFTPFVWAYYRMTKGSKAASLFMSYHVWNLALVGPTLSQQGGKNVKDYHLKVNFVILFFWVFYNIILNAVIVILALFAFAPFGVRQNYIHEAVFSIALKTIWALAVGVKYGFYSEKLLNMLTIRPIPSTFILAEQILANWAPTLDRLMFELRAASLGLPISTSTSMISISKNHPVARYCERCKSVGDIPLCLLRPSILEHLFNHIPTNNFHRVFWTKPPPDIEAEGKTYTLLAEQGVEESYAKYMSHEMELEIGHYQNLPGSDKPWEFVANNGDSSVNVGPASLAGSTQHRKRRNSLFVGGSFITSSEASPTLQSRNSKHGENSSYVQVPAGVLLAYCVVRSWNIGKKWTGSRTQLLVTILAVLSYLIPSAMRVFEPPICGYFQCKAICDKIRCAVHQPMFMGDNDVDIICHVCWLVTCLFWHRVLFNFVGVQLLELKRRAKLTEEWADTLRNGRDSTMRAGMRLVSKDAVLTWYHCREVTRRFRSKMNARLTTVMFFIFLIPVISLSTLGFGIFSVNTAAASFITPKFFAQTMFYSTIFTSAIVLQVFFGSQQNAQNDQENLMLSRLIAHTQYLSCCKSAEPEPGIKISALEGVREGLVSVLSSLKMMRGFEPAKLFFIFPASIAILGSITSVFGAAATAFAQQITDNPCVAFHGIKSFYESRLQKC